MSRENAHQRWAALVSKSAREGRLSADEQQLREALEHDLGPLGDEGELWGAFGGLGQGIRGEADDEIVLDDLFLALDEAGGPQAASELYFFAEGDADEDDDDVDAHAPVLRVPRRRVERSSAEEEDDVLEVVPASSERRARWLGVAAALILCAGLGVWARALLEPSSMGGPDLDAGVDSRSGAAMAVTRGRQRGEATLADASEAGSGRRGAAREALEEAPIEVPAPVEIEAPPESEAEAGTDDASPPEPQRERGAKPSSLGPDALLEAAQTALVVCERETAVARYTELTERYPSTRAGRAARVSLGRLLLDAGHSREALAQFEAYLDAVEGGRLSEEARLGQIRCLRALGRRAQLLEAIDAFRAAHPGSLHLGRVDTWADEAAAASEASP
ncbi:hypothetical protein PPSIR1_14235 [Plesiocystis pacifica SIR-1]|uniref:Tetratricopeptide repeat protein n=1 Tax=Plesiocystis pacifica SIR-1 TaxID=391625 RepID=A6GH25_9BACT|nr:hypothetical protein [Plesiocystis pacifica]EDM74803.1 hypothetical protein PPSIR1_14235 [Plesiocystis pacifica SIR-1]